jgi:hypothetical protein
MRVYNWRDRQPFLKAFKNQPVQMPVTATPGGGPAPMGAPNGGAPGRTAARPCRDDRSRRSRRQEPRLADNEIDPRELDDLQQLVASPGFGGSSAYVEDEWGADAHARIDRGLTELTPGDQSTRRPDRVADSRRGA